MQVDAEIVAVRTCCEIARSAFVANLRAGCCCSAVVVQVDTDRVTALFVVEYLEVHYW